MSQMLTREVSARTVDDSELQSIVAVRPPYLALRDARMGDGELTALVSAEHHRERELSPVSAAEAGRHLAVLSSCGLSLTMERPTRSYFLAREAILYWLPEPGSPVPVGSGPFRVASRGGWTDRRSARGLGTLSTLNGHKLYQLETFFSVIPARVFERMFRDHEMPTPPVALSPYSAPPPLDKVRFDGDCFEAEVGPVDPTSCAGHFERFPALPISVLMGYLSESVGRLHASLHSRTGCYLVTKVKVDAERLAFAGATPSLRARPVSSHGVRAHYQCDARDHLGKVCGRIELWLQSEDAG